MSACSCATNRRCSSRPTSARYSPKVMPPFNVLTIASLARSSLFFGMATRPIAASMNTPIHSTSPPIWRFSGPAMWTPAPLVTRLHASRSRSVRSTPTTTATGSSVYILREASLVCLQSLNASPLRFGRCSLHARSRGSRAAIQSSHRRSGWAALASVSSVSNSSMVHPTKALLKRWAILLDAKEPNPSRFSETNMSWPARNFVPSLAMSSGRAFTTRLLLKSSSGA